MKLLCEPDFNYARTAIGLLELSIMLIIAVDNNMCTWLLTAVCVLIDVDGCGSEGCNKVLCNSPHFTTFELTFFICMPCQTIITNI